MGWIGGIVGKLVVGVTSLAIVLAGISWWQADLAARSAVIDGIGRIVGWTLAVVAAPWAGFLVIGWVARMKSNAAGLAMVALLTLAEAVALAWLFDFRMSGSAFVSLSVAAVLLAGVYNVFASDWIAEKVEG